jgi:hypothetical protein
VRAHAASADATSLWVSWVTASRVARESGRANNTDSYGVTTGFGATPHWWTKEGGALCSGSSFGSSKSTRLAPATTTTCFRRRLQLFCPATGSGGSSSRRSTMAGVGVLAFGELLLPYRAKVGTTLVLVPCDWPCCRDRCHQLLSN